MINHADLFGWGTPVEVERRRRVRLCLAAYAYEVANAPLMTDVEFDTLAYASDPYIRTGHLDDWWIANFAPHTGQWILSHPELTQLRNAYRRLVTHTHRSYENEFSADEGRRNRFDFTRFAVGLCSGY